MRLILVIWGLAGVGIATLSLMGIDSAGFPDGYISPYDRLTLPPLALLSAMLLLSGLTMLVRGVFNRTGWLDAVLGLAMLLGLYLPMGVIEGCPRWQMCTSLFEGATGMGMDDGQGG